MILIVFLVVGIGILLWAEIAARRKRVSEECKSISPSKMKYVIILLCVLLGVFFFNVIVRIPFLFSLFSFAFMMMFYYGFFWVSLNSKSFRKRGKIFRVTSFVLFCYWSILFFEIFQRSMKFLVVRDKYFDNGLEEFEVLLSDITGIVLISLIMSGLFVLVVYLYKRYVR